MDTTDPKEAVDKFRARYPKAFVESIDGEMVRGTCEGCLVPIMEEETEYVYLAEESLYFHKKCVEDKDESSV